MSLRCARLPEQPTEASRTLILETREQNLTHTRSAAVEPHRRHIRHVLTVLCWAYLVALVAAWIFLREAGERWWPATLLMVCPRWPFAVPAVVLWLSVISTRRWGLTILVAAATTFVLGPLIGLRVSLPAGSSEQGDVRLLTCNIHRQQVNTAQLDGFIKATEPDVVALQDWSSAGHESLFADQRWHVRRDGQLLLASRFPIARVTPVNLGTPLDGPADERAAGVCYDLQTPAGPIRLINVHLSSPHGGLLTFLDDHGKTLQENADRRWQESAALYRLVESSTDPVLVAGDFNTTDDSPIFREDWSDYRDAFTDRGLGIGYTYLNRHTQVRIDHIMAGPGWQTVRCWVGPAMGSPHRPLVAELRIR
jgi:vancomycin resistance protein VanJ